MAKGTVYVEHPTRNGPGAKWKGEIDIPDPVTDTCQCNCTWEYKVESLGDWSAVRTSTFAGWGAQGWRLVGIVTNPIHGSQKGVFMRCDASSRAAAKKPKKVKKAKKTKKAKKAKRA